MKRTNESEICSPITSEQANANALQPLHLNPEEYRHALADLDISQAQQDALLYALWHIISTFVDMGWGVDTVRIVLPELFENAGSDSQKMLEQKHHENFNSCSKPEKGQSHD